MGNALIERQLVGIDRRRGCQGAQDVRQPGYRRQHEQRHFLPDRRQALMAGAGDLKLVITLLLMVTRPRRMFAVTDSGP